VPFEGLSKVAQRVCGCQCEGGVRRYAWGQRGVPR